MRMFVCLRPAGGSIPAVAAIEGVGQGIDRFDGDRTARIAGQGVAGEYMDQPAVLPDAKAVAGRRVAQCCARACRPRGIVGIAAVEHGLADRSCDAEVLLRMFAERRRRVAASGIRASSVRISCAAGTLSSSASMPASPKAEIGVPAERHRRVLAADVGRAQEQRQTACRQIDRQPQRDGEG